MELCVHILLYCSLHCILSHNGHLQLINQRSLRNVFFFTEIQDIIYKEMSVLSAYFSSICKWYHSQGRWWRWFISMDMRVPMHVFQDCISSGLASVLGKKLPLGW